MGIGIAVYHAPITSARWHAPQLRFASSLLPICTSSLGGSEGGRAVHVWLPLTSTLTVASHAWFGFCLIGIAVHRARLASAQWHAPQLRFASSLLPICTSSLGGSEGGLTYI